MLPIPGRIEDADVAAAADVELRGTLSVLRTLVADRTEEAGHELERSLQALDDRRADLLVRLEKGDGWGGGGAGLHGGKVTDTAFAGLADLVIRVRTLATVAAHGEWPTPVPPAQPPPPSPHREVPLTASEPQALTDERLKMLASVATEPLPKPVRLRSPQRDVLEELRSSVMADGAPPSVIPPYA
jgi:hypothetical protein